MLNIFIIDQRPILRLGIRYLLGLSLKDFQLHDFSSFQEVSSGVNVASPNLIFIGADTELQGTRILPQLKKIFQDSRFIVYDLNAKSDEGIKYLQSGAHGYLSKNSDLDTLTNCIETVMAGKFYIDPRDIHKMLDGLVHGTSVHRERESVRRTALTPRQNEIANLFAQGLSTSKIARRLDLSSSTVSTVKSIIYRKLKVNSVVDLRDAII